MNDLFCSFGELADRLTSNPLFLALFNVALVVMWMWFGVDVANIFISIITAEIVLIGAGATRRGTLAIHAKLDEIIHAQENARDTLMGVESKSEQAIKEIKDNV